MTIKFKTITYKRILNLGNYESKHLEASIEIPEDTDLVGVQNECSTLMEFVEEKIREDHFKFMNEKIKKLELEIECLQETRKALKSLWENDKEKLNTGTGEGGNF